MKPDSHIPGSINRTVRSSDPRVALMKAFPLATLLARGRSGRVFVQGRTSEDVSGHFLGTVLMKSRPVEGARVVFVPTSNIEAASGITDAEGRYALSTFESGDGTMPGEFRVKVAKYDTSKGPPDEQNSSPTRKSRSCSLPPIEKLAIPAKNILPKKYHSETELWPDAQSVRRAEHVDIKIE